MPQDAAGAIHLGAHTTNALGEADKKSLADEEVSDVQLDDLGNRRHGSDVIIVEAMAGVHFKPSYGGAQCAVLKPRQLVAHGVRLAIRERRAIGAGMQLDRVGADVSRRIDLLAVGVDEQCDANAGVAQPRDERLEPCGIACDVEATLGGELLAALRNEAAIVRQLLQRDTEHLVGDRHLHIDGAAQRFHLAGDLLAHGVTPALVRLLDGLVVFQRPDQSFDIVVGDMATVLAQMRGDVVGAGLDCDDCRAQRIGMVPSPRIAQRCHVIDVDAEADRGRRGHGAAPGVPTTARRCRK